MKSFVRLAATVALVAAFVTPAAIANDPGADKAPPEIQAVKWYNSVPLTFEELKGRAVLVEVFRTW